MLSWIWLQMLHVGTFGVSNTQPQLHTSFLKSKYQVQDEINSQFRIRQVPGDGGCLFHSISTWISVIKSQKHTDFDRKTEKMSKSLRSLAVNVFKSNETVYISPSGEDDSLFSGSLLESVAEHHKVSPETYCRQMLHPGTWGGGPEIVALCNHLACPIHVYSLAHQVDELTAEPRFCLKKAAEFGRPVDVCKPPICLLCADGR